MSELDEREPTVDRESSPEDDASIIPRAVETPLPPREPALPEADGGWPTTPAEIPLDDWLAGRPSEPRPQARPQARRHSRNPVDRLTRGLPDPVRVIVDWIVTIVGAVAIVLLVKAYVVNPYRIPSSSMEPTLHCARPENFCEARFSDRVLANRFIYHLRDPRRGEIIVFHTPDAARLKCGSSGTYVKRLIGLPGETIEVRLRRGVGYVYINGKQLAEPYVKPNRRATRAFGPQKIPKGNYFMMGDNRGQSCDSRDWGTVSRQRLIGKVFATYWPPNRISLR